jgi:uncharacterized protein (TIGR00255 family)
MDAPESAEMAVLLMKYTISEEISRLGSHISEFRLEAERNPSPGKKLDFLCQEMNREINTIGSKTPDLTVSRAVVDMKDALENVREQLGTSSREKGVFFVSLYFTILYTISN